MSGSPSEFDELFNQEISMGATPSNSAVGTFVVKDSGKREQMDTGAQRDTREGKGRFDLIPPEPLARLAIIYEKGAVKYDDRNWEKGMPVSRFMDSALRHLNQFMGGERTEDHLAQAVFNIFGAMAMCDRVGDGVITEDLLDLPWQQDEIAYEKAAELGG